MRPVDVNCCVYLQTLCAMYLALITRDITSCIVQQVTSSWVRQVLRRCLSLNLFSHELDLACLARSENYEKTANSMSGSDLKLISSSENHDSIVIGDFWYLTLSFKNRFCGFSQLQFLPAYPLISYLSIFCVIIYYPCDYRFEFENKMWFLNNIVVINGLWF